MKKRIAVFLVLLCCGTVLLIGCQGADTVEEANNTTSADTIDVGGSDTTSPKIETDDDISAYPVEPISSYVPVDSLDEIVGFWIEAYEDGAFYEGAGVEIVFRENNTGYVWIYYGDGHARCEFSYVLGENGIVAITQIAADSDSDVTLPDQWRTITIYIAKANTYSVLKLELADASSLFVRTNPNYWLEWEWRNADLE